MKLEYGDFYKFIVSVGIGLVAFSVILPWLFLKEPFDLLSTQSDLSNLTDIAQLIIRVRQGFVGVILIITPCISIILFVIGIALIVFGSRKWHTKTQAIIDEIQDINLQMLRAKLSRISESEKREALEVDGRAELEIIQDEVIPDQEPALEQVDPAELSNFVTKAFQVEQKLASRLKSCFGRTYDVLSNRRLGRVEYDILLLSKDIESGAKDHVIELKYVQKGFKYGWLWDNAEKIFYANLHFQREMKRRTVPTLIVIGPVRVLSSSARMNYLRKIRDELALKKIDVSIVYLSEEDLDNLSCGELNKALGYL